MLLREKGKKLKRELRRGRRRSAAMEVTPTIGTRALSIRGGGDGVADFM